MATQKPAPPQAPAVVPQGWNTPQVLKGGLTLLVLLDGLLLLAVLGAVEAHRNAIKVIGTDTAPSIVAAQEIRAALAGMEASAADELLARPGQSEDSVKAYESRRYEVSAALIRAARNINYKEEQQLIETIQNELGTYQLRIQKARDLHERDDPKFLAAYREAAQTMDEKLLPAAGDLDQVNRKEQDREFDSHKAVSTGTRVAVLLAGLALLIGLFVMQSTLTRRTRRTFNLGLLAATFLAFGLIVHTMESLMASSQQLRIAREDAFESIHALSQARAAAYAARADQSRYLLDDADASRHEQAFLQKVERLGRLPQGYPSYTTLVSSLGPAHKIDGFTGYFADELANITFEGERDAAISMIHQFGDFYEADRRIRFLKRSGKRAEAIAMCTGTGNGEAQWAFERFDNALGQTLEINQREFDRAIRTGSTILENFDFKGSGAVVLIAGLIFIGILPRLQEYR